MSKFLRLQATASRLIRENGVLTTIRRTTGTVNPVEGTLTGSTTTTSPVYAVVLPPSSQVMSVPVLEAIGESGIQVLSSINNLLIAVEGLTFEPEPDDEVYINGMWTRLETLTPLKPDDTTVVLYKAFVRRV